MKYPYKMVRMKVDEHNFWVAESLSLKGCVGQGDTQEEALTALTENENVWIETAREYGIAVPEVPLETEQEYSGKMTLRVSKMTHKRAAELARRDGVSLNQFINDALVSYIGAAG